MVLIRLLCKAEREMGRKRCGLEVSCSKFRDFEQRRAMHASDQDARGGVEDERSVDVKGKASCPKIKTQ